MKKSLFTLLFALFIIPFTALAQEGPQIVSAPPSPNVASLGQYGDIPVGEFTGTASVQVPIHTVSSRAGSVPISLNYHSSGIRVSEEAGIAGLGWALSAGGVITRTIRGYDDFGSRDQGVACHGDSTAYTGYWELVNSSMPIPEGPILNSPTAGTNHLLSNDGYITMADFINDSGIAFNNGVFSDLTFCGEVGTALDLESDLYSFNFLGQGGKFVIDKDGDVRFLTAVDFTLDILGTTNDDIRWVLQTADGTKYYFGTTLASRQRTYTYAQTETYNSGIPTFGDKPCQLWNDGIAEFSHVSSWFLDRIESTVGGSNFTEEIILEYQTDSANPIYTPLPNFSANESRRLAAEDLTNGQTGTNCTPQFLPSRVENRTISYLGYDNVYLHKITASSVEEEVYFDMLSGRLDMKGGLELDQIRVERGGEPYKEIRLNYSYFEATAYPNEHSWLDDVIAVSSTTSGIDFLWEIKALGNLGTMSFTNDHDNKRLKLESVEFLPVSGNGLGDTPTYEFQYEAGLPRKSSYATDHWGYFNGATSNESFYEAIEAGFGYQNFTGTPNFLGVVQSGANRNADATYGIAGLMTKVTYPTGGSSCFDYESNEFQVEEWGVGGVGKEEIIIDGYNGQDPIGVPTPPAPFVIDNNHPTLPTYACIRLEWEIEDCYGSNSCSQGIGTPLLVDDPFNNSNPYGFTYFFEKEVNGQYQAVQFWDWQDESGGLNMMGNSLESGIYYSSADIVMEDLEEGINYRIRVEPYGLDYGTNNELPWNVIEVKFSITWHEFEPIAEKQGGGLRIASLTNYSSDETVASWKNYEYTLDGTTTSGEVFNQPVANSLELGIERTSTPNGPGQPPCNSITASLMLIRNSSSVFALSDAYLGNVVTYSKVTIRPSQGGSIEKEFQQTAPELVNYSVSKANIPRFTEIGNGNILSEIVKDDQGNKQSETTYGYNPDPGGFGSSHLSDERFQFVWNYRTGYSIEGEQTCTVDARQTGLMAYADVPQWNYTATVAQKTYDETGQAFTTTTTTNTYEADHFNLRATSISGNAETRTTTYRYAFDDNTVLDYSFLENEGMHGVPVEIDQPNGSMIRTLYNQTYLIPSGVIERFDDGSEVTRMQVTEFYTDGYPKKVAQFGLPFTTEYGPWDYGLMSSKTYGQHVESWKYAHNRNLDTYTAIDGQKVDYVFDGLNRLDEVTARGGGLITDYTYSLGGANQITTEVKYSDDAANNSTTVATFDGLGRPLTTTFNGLLQEGQSYDNLGRVSARTFMPGRWLSMTYESSPLGRVRSEIYPDNGMVSYTYILEQGHNGVLVLDEKGNPAKTLTDMYGRTYKTIDAYGGETTYSYTSWDAPSTIQPPLGPEYKYDYTPFRAIESKTIPGGGTTEYVYDAQHRLAATQTAQGDIVGTIYDSYSRPYRTYLDGALPAQGSSYMVSGISKLLTESIYDDAIQGNRGRVMSSAVRFLRDAGGMATTTYTYDTYGRVTNQSESFSLNGQSYVTNSTNAALTHRDLPGATIFGLQTASNDYTLSSQFNYDDFARVTAVDHGMDIIPSGGGIGNTLTKKWSATYKFDIHGQMDIKQFFQNPTTGTWYEEDYAYNSRGWLETINQPSARGFDVDYCGQPTENVYQGGSITEEVTFEQLLAYIIDGESVVVDDFDNCPVDPGNPPAGGGGGGVKPVQESCMQTAVDSYMNIDQRSGQPIDHPVPFQPVFNNIAFPYQVQDVRLKSLTVTLATYNTGTGEEFIILPGSYDIYYQEYGVDTVNTSYMESEANRLITDLQAWADTEGFSLPEILITFNGSRVDIQILEGEVEFLRLHVNQLWSATQINLIDENDVSPITEFRSKVFNFNHANFHRVPCEEDAATGGGSGGAVTFPLKIYEIDYTNTTPTHQFLTEDELKSATDKYTIDEQYTIVADDQQIDLTLQSGSVIIVDTDGFFDARAATSDPIAEMDLPVNRKGEPIKIPTDEEPCEFSELPVCTQAETELQIKRYEEMIAAIDPDSLTYPVFLSFVELCDGTQVLLIGTETELENELQGNFHYLDGRQVNGPGDLFNIRRKVPDGLFSLELDYEKNGNIKRAEWKTTYHHPRYYNYTYDDLNRLESATYGVIALPGQVAPTIGEGFKADNFTYDAIGNILSLRRYAQLTPGQDAVIIDDLLYQYGSLQPGQAATPNTTTDVTRLFAVEEQGTANDALQNGFMPGSATSGAQYSYDGAGNLITDPYKNITIDYNHLNLPKKIGDIDILYDATGRKWMMEYPDGTVRLYIGGMEFVDDNFETLSLGDGRIYLEEGTAGANDELVAEYWHKDHLGNIRVAFADRNGDGVVQLLDGSAGAAEVNQTLDYYPFGLQHPGAACRPDVDPQNAYRYNGKELIEDVGLYDYGARYYDPAIGRWNAVDPLADTFPSQSPYNYSFNNPLRFIDPDGRAPEDIIILNNSNGASGFGHMALLVGNDDTGWTFISKEGRARTEDGGKAGTLVFGGRPDVAEQSFGSLEEALSSDVVAGSGYDEGYRIETSEEQDATAIETMRSSSESRYHVGVNNCADACSDALEAVGLNGGTRSEPGKWRTHEVRDPQPNKRFDQVIKRNPSGEEVKIPN
ncbi:MAG: RHS repeat-associated core domain-containing protein [Bacteroidota bacterium]